ncbi:YraN family protein [Acetivibrio cellulolyticus]|uniref:YraN family protein n=1 Tax=Acetivibrio cellulolyticus TaxID=35830 RepID=UPI0001E2E779|nr:YraN family protein [Acetivibrio cellulolyticus]
MENTLNNKRTAGTVGEKIAEEYLKEHNYSIITMNFRYKRLGEIDIIARENNYICFVEVKTRSTLEYGLPSEAVNYKKQENIKKLASIFIGQNRLYDANIRFDVVEVYVKKEKDTMTVEKINLIKNAF